MLMADDRRCRCGGWRPGSGPGLLDVAAEPECSGEFHRDEPVRPATIMRVASSACRTPGSARHLGRDWLSRSGAGLSHAWLFVRGQRLFPGPRPVNGAASLEPAQEHVIR